MCYTHAMKTYKYRIYPTKAQETLLEKQLEACRWVYNKTLEIRKNTYEQQGVSLGLYDTQKLLTDWKKEHPFLKTVYSQVLQNVQVRVDLAYKAFFRRVKHGEDPGYPRFKGYGRYDSMCYPQYGNGAELVGNSLNLSKIGSIKVELHRDLCGKAKTVCIRRSSTGKWFVTISCECEAKPLPYEPKATGVDVGTQTFATLSNGEKVANPRFFRNEQEALAKAHRRLSRYEKGTPERKQYRKVVARIYERITNKRTNFAHQQSRRVVNTYGIVAVEKLDIAEMQSQHTLVFGHKLNKSIADVAWHQFVQFLSYKAVDAGRVVVQVEPRNTSKKCSRCSALVPKQLSDRVHNCPHCGLVLDRDTNAAINILALGLQRINAGSPEEVVEAHQL
jgi:putative transposase